MAEQYILIYSPPGRPIETKDFRCPAELQNYIEKKLPAEHVVSGLVRITKELGMFYTPPKVNLCETVQVLRIKG